MPKCLVVSQPDDSVKKIGESGVIALFTHRGPKGSLPSIIVDNGDDAAAFRFTGSAATVVTTDTLLEGVHFDLSYGSPYNLGRKLVAVNASDIASMGATPIYILNALSFPKSTPISIVEGIADGFHEACRDLNLYVIGGNTSSSMQHIVLAATIIGQAQPEHLVRRTGAKVGDDLFVTGHLGDAKAGLAWVLESGYDGKDKNLTKLLESLTNPNPPVTFGSRLGMAGLVNAMCDVSDGLGQDIRTLVESVNLGVKIELGKLPTSDEMTTFCAERNLSKVSMGIRGWGGLSATIYGCTEIS